RGVEVDHVHAAKSGVDPSAHDRARIGKAHALVVERAAHQLHARAIADIDGRDGDHADNPARKARTNWTPASELFSGWNCTPTVRPARTTAGNRSRSCVVHALTSVSSSGRHA